MRIMKCAFESDSCPLDCAHLGEHEEHDIVITHGYSGCVVANDCGHCAVPTYCLPVVGEGGEARQAGPEPPEEVE